MVAQAHTDGRVAPARRNPASDGFEAHHASRDPGLRAALVEQHLGLANALARRFRDRGEPLDDLMQVAAMGLVRAVDRYDPYMGTQFASFAVPTILGELKRHFRDRAWSVRPPRRIKELYVRASRVRDELTQELQRSPTVAEVAAVVGAPEDDVLEAMEASNGYRSASLSSVSDDGDERTSIASRLGELDDGLDAVEERGLLAALVADLPQRERTILYLRFYRGMTQAEIAAATGVPLGTVKSRMVRGLLRLRERLEREGER